MAAAAGEEVGRRQGTQFRFQPTLVALEALFPRSLCKIDLTSGIKDSFYEMSDRHLQARDREVIWR